MYPYFQIAESAEKESIFVKQCCMIFNIPHPDTGKRYLLAKKFPTLATCTRAYKELIPGAEYIVETFLPRKNSKKPQLKWHRIPKGNTTSA
jgi:hypothetical protein